MTESLKFNIDEYYLMNMVSKLYYENNHKPNHDDTKAFIYAVSDILYNPELSLTEDEWDSVVRIYLDNHGLGNEFHLNSSVEQREELFDIITNLDRFKSIELDYILKGYGEHPYSIYDKTSGRIHPTKHTEHYDTLIDIITDEYDQEFAKMDQDDKDNFIMTNFVFIGSSKPTKWYIPDGVPFGLGTDDFSICYNNYN